MTTPIIHVELVEQARDALELRLWHANPNEAQTRIVTLAEIADLVSRAETDYYDAAIAKLRATGERLFRWLDGGERWLSRAIESYANQAQVVALAIATPRGLGHL